MSFIDKYMISDKVVIITGGAGLIGQKHCEAVLEGGGIPVLIDVSAEKLCQVKEDFKNRYKGRIVETYVADITNAACLKEVRDDLIRKYGNIYGLINNAANNPKMEGDSQNMGAIQFHNFPRNIWDEDLAVGLTGAFLCAQIFGTVMEKSGEGVIINVSSDYGLISPNQNVYRNEALPEEEQIIKPVSYSVVKHGIIGLTKYLATYWAKKGVRVNTLCPASLANGQPEEFVKKISELIPMGRMSRPDEYPATILYMLSEASSYMTGATVVLDGGRTIW